MITNTFLPSVWLAYSHACKHRTRLASQRDY